MPPAPILLRRRPTVFGLVVAGLLAWSPAWGDCRVERGAETPGGPLTRHMAEDCTDAERTAQAVHAGEVLAALAAGRGVDLDRAVVLGDLLLDQLPRAGLQDLPGASANLRDIIRAEGAGGLRIIAKPISITNSTVMGAIKSNLSQGLLAVNGSVALTGTRFEGNVDLSRVAFGGPVEVSRAVLLREGFFIHAWFLGEARFEDTTFGAHTRFHRATFMDPVTFRRAAFPGLAEFLEVQFRREAQFTAAAFRLGTGFSGSRFGGEADFSRARFDREAFFTFTVFDKEASFRHTAFGATTDFSDAEFLGTEDFAEATFGGPPRFDRAKPSKDRPPSRGWQDIGLLYAILLALALLAFWWHRRSQGAA